MGRVTKEQRKVYHQRWQAWVDAGRPPRPKRTADFAWMLKRRMKKLPGGLMKNSLGDFDMGAPHIIFLAHYRNGLGIKRCLDTMGVSRNKIGAAQKILNGCGGVQDPASRRIRGVGSRDGGAGLWAEEYDRELAALLAVDKCWARHPDQYGGRSAQMAAYYADHAASKARSAAAAKKRHEKLKHTPEFKMRRTARNAVARICRMVGERRKPKTRTFEFLGCSYDVARAHIEKQFRDGMTWENHGTHWEVDHKKPLAAHDLTIESERMAAMHYTNLQPLLTHENRAKSDAWETAA